MSETMHEANRQKWNADARAGIGQKDRRRDWRQVWEDPAAGLDAEEWAALGEVAGRRIAVLGSGDNLAVLALARRGAQVCSVDISEEQLRLAAERAATVGATVEFLRADCADLGAIADASVDLVYTGGHVAVWLSDLNRAYAEAGRILKPGGRLVVGEYHPFRRLWNQGQTGPGSFQLETPYFARGPHRYEQDGLPAFEHHWTVGDFVSAFRASGCSLDLLQEYGDGREGWEPIDLTGLPRVLLLAGSKR